MSNDSSGNPDELSSGGSRYHQVYPTLDERQLAILERYGERRKLKTDDILYSEGDRHIAMFAILSGTIEATRASVQAPQLLGTHGPGSFTGEVGTLAGRAAAATTRAVSDCEVIVIDEESLRALVIAEAELSETIMRAYILRRVAFIQGQHAGMVVIGSTASAPTLHLRHFLSRNGQPSAYFDIVEHAETKELLTRYGAMEADIPIVVTLQGTVLWRPSNRAVADAIGLSPDRLLIPGGSVKHLHVVARALTNDSGDVEFVGAVMDVTQRKRAEEAQRAQEHEREEMQRQRQQAAKMEALGRLAGGIAHDFNNLLGSILGYGELVQDGLGEGGAVRRHIDQVMQAGARGKELVDRVLAFSRSGMSERVSLHVQPVVEETLELLAASLPAEVRLERQLDAADTAVVGDATQLHQVTMNLCTNAVQAMEQGGVLAVKLERAAVEERRLVSHGTLDAGFYVRLSVSDTGTGIPPAVLERMFDPFFTTKRVGDGTGLGLALVNGIVADLDGAIDVATQIDVGTTFTIWLPAASEMPMQAAESAGAVPRGHGETVMVVDDEPALVALAEETLAQLGYEPVGFDSSVAALQAFRADPKRFELVLADETMPDLTGTELAREIRQLRPEISIILMSGYGGPQLSERAQAAGVIEVLRKPLVRRDIAEPVARALHGGP